MRSHALLWLGCVLSRHIKPALVVGSDSALERREMFNRPYEKGRGIRGWQSSGKPTGLWPSVRKNQICVPLSVHMCAKRERARETEKWSYVTLGCMLAMLMSEVMASGFVLTVFGLASQRLVL